MNYCVCILLCCLIESFATSDWKSPKIIRDSMYTVLDTQVMSKELTGYISYEYTAFGVKSKTSLYSPYSELLSYDIYTSDALGNIRRITSCNSLKDTVQIVGFGYSKAVAGLPIAESLFVYTTLYKYSKHYYRQNYTPDRDSEFVAADNTLNNYLVYAYPNDTTITITGYDSIGTKTVTYEYTQLESGLTKKIKIFDSNTTLQYLITYFYTTFGACEKEIIETPNAGPYRITTYYYSSSNVAISTLIKNYVPSLSVSLVTHTYDQLIDVKKSVPSAFSSIPFVTLVSSRDNRIILHSTKNGNNSFSIQIFDIKGRLVLQQSALSVLCDPINYCVIKHTLPHGTYLLQIRSAKGTFPHSLKAIVR